MEPVLECVLALTELHLEWILLGFFEGHPAAGLDGRYQLGLVLYDHGVHVISFRCRCTSKRGNSAHTIQMV